MCVCMYMCAVLVVLVVFTRACQTSTQNSQYTQIQIVLTQIFLRFSTLYNVTNCVQMISVKLGTTIGTVCDNIYTGCQVNIPCWLYKIPNTHRYKSFWRKSDFTVLCDDLSMCVKMADKCLNTVWTDWHFWCKWIFLIYLGLRLLEPENLFFLGILFIQCILQCIIYTARAMHFKSLYSGPILHAAE